MISVIYVLIGTNRVNKVPMVEEIQNPKGFSHPEYGCSKVTGGACCVGYVWGIVRRTFFPSVDLFLLWYCGGLIHGEP